MYLHLHTFTTTYPKHQLNLGPYTLPETNIAPEHRGWKTSFLLGWPIKVLIRYYPIFLRLANFLSKLLYLEKNTFLKYIWLNQVGNHSVVGWVWAGVGVVILPKKHLCQTSSFVFCTRSTDRISNNYSRHVCILMHNQYSHVGKKHICIRKEALSWISKINTEPENHPFGKVHHLQQLHFLEF